MTNIYNGSTINRKCFVAKGYKKKNYIVPLKSKWSGKQDLNLQPLGPKPSALPS